MASTQEVDQLVGKLLLDPAFRREFGGDPKAAASKINILLTEEQVQSFKDYMSAFIGAAAELEKEAAATATGQGGAHALGHVAAIFRR